MARFKINPQMLQRARECEHLTSQELAEQIGASLPDYEKLEAGEQRPTMRQPSRSAIA